MGDERKIIEKFFDDDAPASNERAVFDNDRPCLGRFKNATDAETAADVHILADPGTRPNGYPCVDQGH